MKTEYTHKDRKHEVFQLEYNEDTLEAHVTSDITLDDYRSITREDDWRLLERFAKQMEGKTVVFINPTMSGGGVAMLRPPLVYLLRLLGVDAHWFVMQPRMNPHDENPFLFTKQMHNIMQRRTEPGEHFNEMGKAVHQDWNRENAQTLTRQPEITDADVIVIDDPQPAPLKPYIEKVNPDAKLVWRNHIDTDGELMANPATPQGQVADYIFNELDIGEVDAMITHPIERFVHPEFADKTYFAPATIEPFDDLNRELSTEEIDEGVAFVNQQIEKVNHEFEREGREDDIQPLIDPGRRRITLIARFDESKGMDKALRLGVETNDILREAGVAEEELPQIILTGNGSVDDPSGIPMYETMLQERREQYRPNKDNIIIARLPHNYMAMNALMYPQPNQDGSYDGRQLVALQTSEAEGCETRITDWIRHGVPLVISNRGGMKLQVNDGESGLILDYDKPDFDVERGAKWIADLMLKDGRYQDLRESTLQAAEEFNSREFTTVANTTRLLRLFSRVLEGEPADRQWRIQDMTEGD